MRASAGLFETLNRVADLLRGRYRSHEAADALDLHLETLGECRSPEDLRDRLGEILEAQGTSVIKPPQFAAWVESAFRSLFYGCDPDATDSAGAPRWPAHLLAVADRCRMMLDPYAAATCDLARLPTGTYLISLEPADGAQSPAASNSKSVVALPSPATSTKVAKSPSGKVRTSAGATAQTI